MRMPAMRTPSFQQRTIGDKWNKQEDSTQSVNRAASRLNNSKDLCRGLPENQLVWMSAQERHALLRWPSQGDD